MGRSPSVWQMVAIRSPWALLSSFALLFCHSRNMKLDFQNASKPLIYGARLLEGFEPELKWHHAHNHEDISRILIFKSTGKPLRTRYLQKNGTYRHFFASLCPPTTQMEVQIGHEGIYRVIFGAGCPTFPKNRDMAKGFLLYMSPGTKFRGKIKENGT